MKLVEIVDPGLIYATQEILWRQCFDVSFALEFWDEMNDFTWLTEYFENGPVVFIDFLREIIQDLLCNIEHFILSNASVQILILLVFVDGRLTVTVLVFVAQRTTSIKQSVCSLCI